MKVLVCGATGCIGQAVVQALRQRGHTVVEGRRQARDPAQHLHIDYTAGWTAAEWQSKLNTANHFDVVINAVGILMPHGAQTFARIHTQAPIALFQGAAAAGVRRAIQISALGVGRGADALQTPYAQSKLQADEALLDLARAAKLDAVVVRPSMVYGPGSQSGALFRTLASLPVVSLPGGGRQLLQPISVLDLAQVICSMVEHPSRLPEVVELGGPQALSYKDMLSAFRHSMGKASPLWLPVPMPLMRAVAQLATWLPQHVFSPDTMTMLEHGSTTSRNGAAQWLGREPTPMADALRVQ